MNDTNRVGLSDRYRARWMAFHIQELWRTYLSDRDHRHALHIGLTHDDVNELIDFFPSTADIAVRLMRYGECP